MRTASTHCYDMIWCMLRCGGGDSARQSRPHLIFDGPAHVPRREKDRFDPPTLHLCLESSREKKNLGCFVYN